MDGQTDRQTNGRWMDRLTEGQWLPARMPSTLTSGTDFERRHTDGKRPVVGTLLEHRHSDVPIRFVQDWSALIQRHPNSCKTSCRLYVSQPHTDGGHRQQCILLTETHCSMITIQSLQHSTTMHTILCQCHSMNMDPIDRTPTNAGRACKLSQRTGARASFPGHIARP